MKTTLISALLLATGLSLYGQGTVFFSTHTGGDVDAPVKRPDGTGAGVGITAQLVLVTATGDLVPLSPTTTFLTSSPAAAYYISSVVVNVPGEPSGSVVTLRMRAYNGPDYDHSTLRGQSSDVTVTLAGGIMPPPDMVGLQGFTMSSGGTAPTITTDPQGQTLPTGSTVTFTVAATGSTPLTYRWQKNDSDIAGATSATLKLSNLAATDSGKYRVIVGNSAGSTPSQEALLTVLAAPHITSSLQNQSAALGAPVSFAVQAQGSSLNYQWQHNGKTISGASGSVLKLPAVQSSDAGTYQVVVSNPVGQDSSSATLSVQGNSFVSRQLPAGYSPGAKLVVSLQAAPNPQTLAYVVEDQLPPDWTVGAVSNDGVFDPVTQKVKFGPILDTTPRTLTYEATPPTKGTEPVHFVGHAVADGISSLISGDDTLTVLSFHPADNNPADMRLTAVELTAYLAAWKSNHSWPQGPNPIPASYVSRAGTLWRGGETYKVDSTVAGGPPLWWVSTGVKPQTVAASPHHSGRANAQSDDLFSVELPDRYVPGTTVTIKSQVNPPSGTLSYLVEEDVPAGWTVSNISDDGVYDAESQKVKWGLFFDDNTRELSFDMTGPTTGAGAIHLAGLASFDGQDVVLNGKQVSVPSSKLGHPQRNQHGGVDITLSGGGGTLFMIESSTDLIHWSPVQTVSSPTGSVQFDDPEAGTVVQKFYRTVIQP